MRKLVALLTIAAITAGCTTSSESFYKDRSKGDKTSLCRAYLKASTEAFRQDIGNELARRGVFPTECQTIVQKQNTAIAAGVALAVVGAVAVACASSSCGGGGGYSRPNAYSGGYGADWDQFYNQYGQLVWACRDISSGQFTYQSECYGMAQTDYRWPGA
jgi:hypothetical protein